MTTTEAFLEGDDRNFTINFGPQHPAAHGVLRQEYRGFDFMSPWEGAKYVLPGDEKEEG